MTEEKEIQLSKSQLGAEDALLAFFADPKEKFFVLKGSAGCGKTTLVKSFLENIPKYREELKLLNLPEQLIPYTTRITATTNKACSVLSDSLANGERVKTIFSLLGFYITFDQGKPVLKEREKAKDVFIKNALVIVDEANFIDQVFFKELDRKTYKCKIILIGDPYQLPPVKGKPIMDLLPAPQYELDEIMRNSGSIIEISQQYRRRLLGEPWEKIEPNDELVTYIDDREEFQKMIDAAFKANPDKAKILCWKNKTAILFNKYIRELFGYPPEFQPGESVFVNSAVSKNRILIPTDSLVKISSIQRGNYTILANDGDQKNFTGYAVKFAGRTPTFFLPDNYSDKKIAEKFCEAKGEKMELESVNTEWVDLRSGYAMTVHKSQGSTFETVFVDLDNLSMCHQPEMFARLMYVAISRASKNVVICGELPKKYGG